MIQREPKPLLQSSMLWRARALPAGEEEGDAAAEDAVPVHDLQATILHLLGFDHTQLIYRFQGRDFRLTDVHGHVVKDLLA